jgi:hypothetical protein
MPPYAPLHERQRADLHGQRRAPEACFAAEEDLRMKSKTIYLLLCVVGTILPYSQFVPWLLEHGLNLRLFVDELLFNRISTFFALDVIVSAVVLIGFMRVEHSRNKVRRRWLPILAVLTVGVSLAFPLFLYLRELELEQGAVANQ